MVDVIIHNLMKHLVVVDEISQKENRSLTNFNFMFLDKIS